MGFKAHTLLILVRPKRTRFLFVNRSIKLFRTDCEEAAKAFVRDWNTRHGTKTMQVWLREERRLHNFGEPW
jgi:hypothetical protein